MDAHTNKHMWRLFIRERVWHIYCGRCKRLTPRWRCTPSRHLTATAEIRIWRHAVCQCSGGTGEDFPLPQPPLYWSLEVCYAKSPYNRYPACQRFLALGSQQFWPREAGVEAGPRRAGGEVAASFCLPRAWSLWHPGYIIVDYFAYSECCRAALWWKSIDESSHLEIRFQVLRDFHSLSPRLFLDEILYILHMYGVNENKIIQTIVYCCCFCVAPLYWKDSAEDVACSFAVFFYLRFFYITSFYILGPQ